ncbi:MAG: NfeD family protein [Isosphaeraceae bacterium]
MMQPPSARKLPATILLAIVAGLLAAPGASGQGAGADAEGTPGQFFLISQPITSNALEQLQASALEVVQKQAKAGKAPILFFEIRPGNSPYGLAHELADFLSSRLTGARTVAFVPEPLSGYGLLPALACREIVMGPEATLGPISPQGQPVDASKREFVRILAQRTGNQEIADLWIGMLDREADLRRVRTADGRLRYALPERLAELKRLGIQQDDPAWPAGKRGILDAPRAREEMVKLLAKDRAEVGRAYGVKGLADDPTLGQKIKPVWIKISGPLDTVKESFLRRRVGQARQEGANLIFFQFDCPGGAYPAADSMADYIARVRDAKTVAFIDDRALGVATLPALACDEIVFARAGQLGQANEMLVGWSGQRSDPLDPKLIGPAARKAADLARQKGHPEALAYAMVDPDAVLVAAKDNQTGASALLLESQALADPQRYSDPIVKKKAGRPLLLKADEAVALRLAKAVVPDASEFQALYGLRGQSIRAEGANWVDSLVTALNTPWMKGMLLFIGLFMLVIELKLPGIGLPAIVSAMAFLLFFWSSYLSGTADSLEIILFLVGLVCIALELFVFPGFGVFGMSGILLVLVSVVMASHTFVWPSSESEYRELAGTLVEIALALTAVAAGVALVGRYFKSIPLLNRMVLKPEAYDGVGDAKVMAETYARSHLIGETGRTATVLRPAGKVRFGADLLDVIAVGDYIEPDRLVVVVDVQGSRILVKRV